MNVKVVLSICSAGYVNVLSYGVTRVWSSDKKLVYQAAGELRVEKRHESSKNKPIINTTIVAVAKRRVNTRNTKTTIMKDMNKNVNYMRYM